MQPTETYTRLVSNQNITLSNNWAKQGLTLIARAMSGTYIMLRLTDY